MITPFSMIDNLSNKRRYVQPEYRAFNVFYVNLSNLEVTRRYM